MSVTQPQCRPQGVADELRTPDAVLEVGGSVSDHGHLNTWAPGPTAASKLNEAPVWLREPSTVGQLDAGASRVPDAPRRARRDRFGWLLRLHLVARERERGRETEREERLLDVEPTQKQRGQVPIVPSLKTRTRRLGFWSHQYQ